MSILEGTAQVKQGEVKEQDTGEQGVCASGRGATGSVVRRRKIGQTNKDVLN